MTQSSVPRSDWVMSLGSMKGWSALDKGRAEMKRNKEGIYKDRRGLASYRLELSGGLSLVSWLVPSGPLP